MHAEPQAWSAPNATAGKVPVPAKGQERGVGSDPPKPVAFPQIEIPSSLLQAMDPQAKSKCVHFIVLTMQRSGSTWLLDHLPKAMLGQARVTWEAFNAMKGQAGSQLLALAGLVKSGQTAMEHEAMMHSVGARRWATYVWHHLENSTAAWLGPPLTEPCAVGFKMMGPEVDTFSQKQSEELLMDPKVKKIVLDRRDTYAQWLSRQWACWSNDFSSHKNGSDYGKDFDWKRWTELRASRGEFCKCGQATYLEGFARFKEDVYEGWRRTMGGRPRQRWLELETEKLSDSELFARISEYLFSPDIDSTPLTEAGYRLQAATKNSDQMRAFIHKVIDAHGGVVKDEGGLSGLVPYHSGAKATQSYHALINDLHSATWLAGFHDGSNAPLTLDGYEMIKKLQSSDQMRTFIERVIADHGAFVTRPGGLSEFVPSLSDVLSNKTFADLLSDLHAADWLSGFLDAASVPLNEAGYKAIAALAGDWHMRAFIQRVVEAGGGTVLSRGGLAALTPYHSGLRATQTFVELTKDLATARWVRGFKAPAELR